MLFDLLFLAQLEGYGLKSGCELETAVEIVVPNFQQDNSMCVEITAFPVSKNFRLFSYVFAYYSTDT